MDSLERIGQLHDGKNPIFFLPLAYVEYKIVQGVSQPVQPSESSRTKLEKCNAIL